MPLHRNSYKFTQNWFDGHIPQWESNCSGFAKRAKRIPKIGAFEGASTTWILDHLLSYRLSKLITIDNFKGGIEHRDSRCAEQYSLESLETRFWQNIYRSEGRDKLQLIKGDYGPILTRLRVERVDSFDLIYIDGSHIAAHVISDAILAWPLLNSGGFLVFDDYKWDHYSEPHDNSRLAIDCFLVCFAPFLEVVQLGYQVWLLKIERRSAPIERI